MLQDGANIKESSVKKGYQYLPNDPAVNRSSDEYQQMGFEEEEDYKRNERRFNPRYKGEMSEDNAPYKKECKGDNLPKGSDYNTDLNKEY